MSRKQRSAAQFLPEVPGKMSNFLVLELHPIPVPAQQAATKALVITRSSAFQP